MGIYFGNVKRVDDYYNFKPLYEISEGNLMPLNENDYDKLLPESELQNINLMYNHGNDDDFYYMEDYFDDAYIIMEFETDKLQANINRQGERNRTGYKVQVFDEINSGRIELPSKYKIYQVISEKNYNGNVMTDTRLVIKDNVVEPDFLSLSQSNSAVVVIEMKDGSGYAGPFTAVQGTDDTYTITIKRKENNYLLPVYSPAACQKIKNEFRSDEFFIRPNKAAKPKYIDIINESELLNSFADIASNNFLIDGKFDFEHKDEAIKSWKESALMIDDDSIRQNRYNRLINMLEIAEDADDTLAYLSDLFRDSLIKLMGKYDSRSNEGSFGNMLINKYPELLRHLNEYSAAEQRIQMLNKKRNQAEEELSDLASQGKQIKQSALEYQNLNEISGLKEELEKKRKDKEKLEREISELVSKHNDIQDLSNLESYKEKLSNENEFLEKRKDKLNQQVSELGNKLTDVMVHVEQKLSDISIDEAVANILVESSAKWNIRKDNERYSTIISEYENVDIEDLQSEELIDYICGSVQKKRPSYNDNMIINICISIFQSFITVFSGQPGSGKTSICNIIGDVLGLNKVGKVIHSELASRYIPVSVERGWTSKRDFIGYYNPLTKTFDKSNKRVFEALKLLDCENSANADYLPMLILLDEANLSPMEYYWADFMNVCDDLEASNEINIGNDEILHIPDTLHFLATINNDHTTESLSPRLVDRSSVIVLPKTSLNNMKFMGKQVAAGADETKIISYSSIRKTFAEGENSDSFGQDAQAVYSDILKHLRKMNIAVSPRITLAVMKYCSTGSRIFRTEADEIKREPYRIAIDFAVAQKILPKINGYGEEYRKWLEEFMNICEINYLYRCREIIEDIIARGDSNMDNYQFFA